MSKWNAKAMKSMSSHWILTQPAQNISHSFYFCFIVVKPKQQKVVQVHISHIYIHIGFHVHPISFLGAHSFVKHLLYTEQYVNEANNSMGTTTGTAGLCWVPCWFPVWVRRRVGRGETDPRELADKTRWETARWRKILWFEMDLQYLHQTFP